jgi:chromosome segregation ATPase
MGRVTIAELKEYAKSLETEVDHQRTRAYRAETELQKTAKRAEDAERRLKDLDYQFRKANVRIGLLRERLDTIGYLQGQRGLSANTIGVATPVCKHCRIPLSDNGRCPRCGERGVEDNGE